jgi:hypothetical protein
LPHNHLQHRQDVGQEVAADSAQFGVKAVTEDRGEVEIATTGKGRAAHGAKRVENLGDVVAAGGRIQGIYDGVRRGDGVRTPGESEVVVA